MKYIVWFSWWIDSIFCWMSLKSKWFDVLFVNIKNTIWKNKCCKIEPELINISKTLWIPIEFVDWTDIFKQIVIDDFIEKYKNWKTPNPCIRCNEFVRFVLLNRIRQQKGYDFISTGHYSKVVNIDWEKYIWQANDQNKDQSYMLYRLSNVFEKNERIMNFIEFEMWDKIKNEIKDFIAKKNISINTGDESQNICFVEDMDYPKYIKNNSNIIYSPWKIFDNFWNFLWNHKWIIYYTIWQRHWLEIDSKWQKLYVLEIDHKKNEIILWDEKYLYKNVIYVDDFFIHNDLLWKIDELYWKIRYRMKMEKIKKYNNLQNKVEIEFENSLRAPTKWQHLVVYWKLWNEFIVLWWWIIC